jgi:hypothetical protein
MIRSGKYITNTADDFPAASKNLGALAQALDSGALYISDGTDWNPLVSRSDGQFVDNTGAVFALSEAVNTVAITTTTTAFTGACEFRGIVVRAIVGTPQTITVYDNTSATGTAIAVFTVSAVGTYFWDGDWTTVGVGAGGRRKNSLGCHVVVSGGTSRTIDVMVE